MPTRLSDIENSLSRGSESFFGTPSENGYTALDSKKAAKKALSSQNGPRPSTASKLRRISLKPPFLKRNKTNLDAFALSTALEEREEAQNVRRAEQAENDDLVNPMTGTAAYNGSAVKHSHGHGVSNIKRRSLLAASKITQVRPFVFMSGAACTEGEKMESSNHSRFNCICLCYNRYNDTSCTCLLHSQAKLFVGVLGAARL